MAYTYFIKQEAYNKFYKNFWTDYFVYQYKATPVKSAMQTIQGEYRVQGSNASMTYSTWSEYRKRLNNVLEVNYSGNPFIEIYPEVIPGEDHSGIPEIESFKRIIKRKKLDSDGGAHFVTWDSRALRNNPLHATYRCCKPNEFSRYLKILSCFHIAKDPKLNYVTKTILQTSELYNYVCPSTASDADTDSEPLLDDETNTRSGNSLDAFRESIYYYEKLGLLERYDGLRNADWRIPHTTLKDILGENIDEERLICALQFFSNTLPFGSVGVNLLRRLGIDNSATQPISEKAGQTQAASKRDSKKLTIGGTVEEKQKNRDVFRYKHNFTSQALNDYNLIDLLYSIENGEWCRIEYRNPIKMELKTLICYPIQIRSSADDGRQYIFCFEPTNHLLSNIRVDQIESVSTVKSVSGKADCEYMTRLCGENSSGVITAEKLTNLYSEEIENAREWLKYCWGASAFSVGKKIEKPIPEHLRVTVSFDPESEDFILNRLKRERRFGCEPLIDMKKGTATFEIDVLDARELNKWIQSYYRRVHISSVEPKASAERLMENYQNIAKTYLTHELQGGSFRDGNGELYIPDEITVTKGDSFHYHIFNEFMGDSAEYTMREIYSPSSSLNGRFEPDCGPVLNELREHYECAPMPAASCKEFYCSILPLLGIEKRWLLSMLSHPMIELFFNNNEISNAISRLEKGGVKKLITSDKICVFGQHSDMNMFYSDGEKKDKYIRFFRILLNAVRDGKWVLGDYKNRSLKGIFYPMHIEYSLREKRFRAVCLNAVDGSIYSCNIERFDKISANETKSIKMAKECYSTQICAELLARYVRKHRKYVTVRFTDRHNCADRLLNEFSSYRKCCTKNRQMGVYTMVLWFDEADSKDIAIRLMGYGANAEVDGDETGYSAVRREILARLRDQAALNRMLEQTIDTDTEGIK